MIIRSSDADEIRQVVADRDLTALRRCRIEGLTLGALFELASASNSWRHQGYTDASDALDAAVRHPSLLQSAIAHLGGGEKAHRNLKNDVFGAPELELHPLRERADFAEEKWWMFLDRFRRSIVNLGFPRKLAPGIAAAFNEMADNIGKHSARDDHPMAPGLAGYHVVDGQFTFAVVDLGRGVLESLKENPAWAQLRSSTDALVAAACEQATRRAENDFGDGFKQLFLSLVDLNGTVRLRSEDGVLHVFPHQNDRLANRGFCPPLQGLSVVVTVSLAGPPTEQEISENLLDSFL